MNKSLLYLCITVLGSVGGYLPTLLGAGGFSGWTVLGSTVGGILGVFVAKKLSE